MAWGVSAEYLGSPHGTVYPTVPSRSGNNDLIYTYHGSSGEVKTFVNFVKLPEGQDRRIDCRRDGHAVVAGFPVLGHPSPF